MEKVLEKEVNLKGNFSLKKIGIVLIVLIFLAVFPLVFGSYLTGIFVIIGFYTLTTIGLTLLMGFAGLISLAQAAFWGIGAYGTGILATKFQLSIIPSIFCAMILCGILAAILSFITRNLEGHTLSLATLGFGIVINIILVEETEWTGGSSGLLSIPNPSVGNYSLSGDVPWFYVIWLLILMIIVLMKNLLSSNWGINLKSIHTSVVAARAMGINTSYYRLKAFVISAVLAGLSGGLYASYMGFISPALFNFEMSIEFVLMAVLGGLGSIYGATIGATIVTLLTEGLRDVTPLFLNNTSAVGALEIIFFGVTLAVIMMFMPNGVLGIFLRFTTQKGEKKND